MRKRWKRVGLVLGAVLLVVYVGSYVALSRQGYAEAARDGYSGFYYFTPEQSDGWRFRNYACVNVFWPLNEIDRALGLGKYPGSEPMWGLSK